MLPSLHGPQLFFTGWLFLCRFSFTWKSIAQFLPKLDLASYFCCLSLHSFLTTERHPSDVELSYIPIFRLTQSAVYPVGVFNDCTCFMQMINYNSKDLVWILTKIDTDNFLWMPYKCVLNFSWIGVQVCVLQRFFQVCKKTKKKTWKFAHSYLGNALCNFLQIWYVISLGRQAPPHELWCSLNKRSWSYESQLCCSC